MDLVENIEELVKVVTSIKNQVINLNGHDINARLDEIEHETEALKEEITDMRRTLMQQNETILSLIINQNDTLLEARRTYDFSNVFPLKSLRELDELEGNINDNNIHELIDIVRRLLQPHGIIKNIGLIMASSLIMECNVYGKQNKRRLLKSPKFMNLIYRAAHDDGTCSLELHLNEFSRSLHMAKNRHNQSKHHKRQRGKKKELAD